ncbi:MAG: hypothetical protein ACPHF2_02570 [Crocinitomicaceae bacterium]
MSEKTKWNFTQHQPNTHRLGINDLLNKQQRIALMSDLHWDNPHCMLERLAEDLQAAVDADAPIMLFGDTFCAMQGKWDRRASKSCLRPEHQCDDYLDALVRTAAEWFEPYLSHLCLVGLGNHETAITKRHETCLITRFVERCKMINPDSPISKGGYSGWLKIVSYDNAGQDRFRKSAALALAYTHGYGGGGPVTRGAIQQQRMSAMYESDIVVMGHVHERQHTEMVKVSLSHKTMKEKISSQHHLRCSTYKDEFSLNEGLSWHRDNGRPPKPIGGWWLDVELLRRRHKNEDSVFMRSTPVPML